MASDSEPPSSLTSTFETRDGRTLLIRPILLADHDAYVTFVRSLSDQAIYYRFFSPRRELTETEIDHFLRVDYLDRLALVVLDGEAIVGVGRYDRLGQNVSFDDFTATDAEVAFVVADAYQGQGIASQLLRRLGAAALENGITRLIANVLPDNHKMMTVFAAGPWRSIRRFADGLIEVVIDLTAEMGSP